MTPDFQQLVELAREFRELHSLRRGDGWVLFWEGKPFGWSVDLQPEHVRPGVHAVSQGGVVRVATGGNDTKGARFFSTVET